MGLVSSIIRRGTSIAHHLSELASRNYVVILTFSDVTNSWRYWGNSVASAFKVDVVPIKQYNTLLHEIQIRDWN